MSLLTNGYIRYAFVAKDSDTIVWSVEGDGWANICELEVLDTYGTKEEAEAIFKNQVPDCIKKLVIIKKVIYEFRPFVEKRDWNNKEDNSKYLLIN